MQAAICLIPGTVGWELRRECLIRRCVSPACSLGACLCSRTSVDVLRAGWGVTPPFGTPVRGSDGVEALLESWSEGVPGTQGVVLRSPPRPDSQLAEAGVEQGDRILSVDGQDVSANLELQVAIRRHQLREEVRLKIERATGTILGVVTRHVHEACE